MIMELTAAGAARTAGAQGGRGADGGAQTAGAQGGRGADGGARRGRRGQGGRGGQISNRPATTAG
jgi:hypothetical protein